MRLDPGTEGKRWVGEATVYQDLTNPVDYRSGDTLTFAVAGVVPGNIGGPQPTKQEVREEEQAEREIELLKLQTELLEVQASALTINEEARDTGESSLSVEEDLLAAQAETIEAIMDLESQAGGIGTETADLLEEILNRLFEME
jgi:hypothetical protein